MGVPCLKPLPLYRPRDPQASDLWRLLDGHFETFREVYTERFQDKYGFWQLVVDRSVAAFLKCGDLHEGFALDLPCFEAYNYFMVEKSKFLSVSVY